MGSAFQKDFTHDLVGSPVIENVQKIVKTVEMLELKNWMKQNSVRVLGAEELLNYLWYQQWNKLQNSHGDKWTSKKSLYECEIQLRKI